MATRRTAATSESTPSQTAWAVLGLMAAGAADHPAVARGIAYLAATQSADGEWTEMPYTAVGFPRVFYLRYHGYRLYFPLLALARYRNLRRGNTRRVAFGSSCTRPTPAVIATPAKAGGSNLHRVLHCDGDCRAAALLAMTWRALNSGCYRMSHGTFDRRSEVIWS